MRTIYSCIAALLVILAGAALFSSHVLKAGPDSATTPKSTTSQDTTPGQKMHLAENYGKLPLSFEANQGQVDSRVKFLSRGSGYTLFLTGDEAILSLRKADVAPTFRSARADIPSPSRAKDAGLKPGATTPADKTTTDSLLRMKLVGANASAAVMGADELPGKSNYFIGNDPKKWRTNVPNYGKVKYADVYPGVDLVYYGNQRQLEYDFVVAPGADPSLITLDVGAGLAPPSNVRDGGAVPNKSAPVAEPTKRAGQAPPLRIAADGDLVVNTDSGEVRLHKPVVYQTNDAGRRSYIDGRYLFAARKSKITNPKSQISFDIAAYDHTKPLVIDPVLSYSTYLGGSGTEQGYGIAVDSSGSAYVTGGTASTDFPTVNPLQATNHGGYDAFVAKLNAAGSALVYSTYLGGSRDDFGLGIAVGSSGSAYVTGQTQSTDFPTVNPLQAFRLGQSDAFVAELNPTGSALIYSTYLGGRGDEDQFGTGIAVDSSGNAYVTGDTTSIDFPTVNPLQPTNHSIVSGFVAKLNSVGSALVYSTYLGGSNGDASTGIAVDSSGNAYVTGFAESGDFPTVNPLQATNHGPPDAFVSKLNAAGSALVYSTYLGGSNGDQATGIAVDSSGNAYVTGYTASTDFPTFNPLQATNHGPPDAFVSKLNATGSALVYSTYLGGSNEEVANGIAVDSSGNAYVIGRTYSTDFPTVNPLQSTNRGAPDAFVTQLNAAGSALAFSTYLGGSNVDFGRSIAVDSSGSAYVTGYTSSVDFPIVNPLQATNHGNSDAFVSKIAPSPNIALLPSSLSFGNQAVGSTSAPLTITLTNTGSLNLSITSISLAGTNRNDFAETNNCGHTVAPGASCAINVTFKPKATGNRTASVSIKDNAPGSPHTAALSGVGTGPNVKLTPPSLTFPTQLVSTTSNPKTVTLMNTGNATLNITSVAASGDFSQTNTCGSSVGAGLSCTFSIAFKPTTAGTRTGSVSITDDAPLSPQMIHLTGTGTIVIVSPKNVNFGRQKVGTTSSVKSVTVTNASTTTTLNISGITIGGTNPGDFAIDPSSTCPTSGGTLGPSSVCSINLKFTPAATGLRKATVSISDDGGASPQIVTLAGTGT